MAFAGLAFVVLFSACTFFDKVVFSELEVGENFYHSRDGHYKKLPHNYCLWIDLGSTASLFKVPDDRLDVSLNDDVDFPDAYLKNAFLEAHYIYGYYNDEYLILWEEKSDNSYAYLSFAFSSQAVEHYADITMVYERFGFQEDAWIPLCNENKDIL